MRKTATLAKAPSRVNLCRFHGRAKFTGRHLPWCGPRARPNNFSPFVPNLPICVFWPQKKSLILTLLLTRNQMAYKK